MRSGGGRGQLPILAALLLLSACRGSSGGGTVEDVYEFSSLEEMASSSDAIVFGRIEQAEPTRVVGGMQFVELMIDVEDALKGPTGVPVIIEVVDRLGFQVGDVGYWFLHRKKDAPDRVLYRLANSESAFLVRGGRIEPIDPTRPWIAAFDGASENTFRVAVSDAVASEVVPPSPAF